MRESTDRDIAASGSILLHVLLGEAAFALALLRSTKVLPPQGKTVLSRLAQELLGSTAVVTTTQRAVGDVNGLDLAIAANSVFNTGRLNDLGDQLTSTARELESILLLAERGQPIVDSTLSRLIDDLHRMEDVVAAMDALPTDEVMRGESWHTY